MINPATLHDQPTTHYPHRRQDAPTVLIMTWVAAMSCFLLIFSLKKWKKIVVRLSYHNFLLGHSRQTNRKTIFVQESPRNNFTIGHMATQVDLPSLKKTSKLSKVTFHYYGRTSGPVYGAQSILCSSIDRYCHRLSWSTRSTAISQSYDKWQPHISISEV